MKRAGKSLLEWKMGIINTKSNSPAIIHAMFINTGVQNTSLLCKTNLGHLNKQVFVVTSMLFPGVPSKQLVLPYAPRKESRLFFCGYKLYFSKSPLLFFSLASSRLTDELRLQTNPATFSITRPTPATSPFGIEPSAHVTFRHCQVVDL